MKFRKLWRSRPDPKSSPSRRVVLPAEDSEIHRNGHSSPPVSPPEAQEGPQEAPGRDPERILVFPASIVRYASLFSPGPFTGFRGDAMEMAGRLFPHGVHGEDFHPRSPSLETDETFVQVVACVVPWNAASRQVWTYRRGDTETRLGGKVSCLVGGHVNLSDAYSEDHYPAGRFVVSPVDLLDATFRAAIREMGEEMDHWPPLAHANWKSYHSDVRLTLIGVVRDDSSEVDRVHLGFVYRLDLATLHIPMTFAKEAGEGAGWKDVRELECNADRVESWSRHVARHLMETSPVGTTG